MSEHRAGSEGMPVPSPLLAHRVVELPGDPASAGQARQVLREVLRSVGRERWLEAAELACTELVSNAVLHAHSTATLTVDVGSAELLVQVRDRSAVLPRQRSYDRRATTGRGMGLVAAITSDHGISAAGPDGKTVWFALRGEPQEPSGQDLLDAWDDPTWDLDELLGELAGVTATLVPVALRSLPPTLWTAARAHHEALLRELALYLAEHPGGGLDVAAADRARDAVSGSVGRFADADADADADAEGGSAARGQRPRDPGPFPPVAPPVDVDLEVPASAGQDFRALRDVLEAAEELAGQDLLLARPGIPEVVALTRWALGEVLAQLEGGPATPWGGADQEAFTTATGPVRRIVPRWDPEVVRRAQAGVVALDAGNRLLAVSAHLAHRLGREPEDLVGRRMVVLLPPRLREGHAVWFTRYLVSGETTLFQEPFRLPLLHADGREVPCRVDATSDVELPGLYLAWFTPLEG